MNRQQFTRRTKDFMRGRSLAERMESGRDNILLLRLVAALLVVFGHSYVLAATGALADEPLHRVFPRTYAHLIGVTLFFTISGFLVTLSYARRPHLWRYLRARMLRLWPALIVVVVAWAFAIGPLVTTLPLNEYFDPSRVAGNTYRYVYSNILLFAAQPSLPGLFATNPVPTYVNGSLWTIPYEVAMYLCVAVLGVLGLLRFRWLTSLIIAATITIVVLRPMYDGAAAFEGGSFLGLQLAACFGVGSIACLLCRHIPISTGIMLVVGIAGIIWRDTVFFWPFVIYFVFWFAYCPRLPAMPRNVDLSYGTYLWAFPLQQYIVSTNVTDAPLALFAIATPMALLIAAISWFKIEKPALRYK